jgi:hypothetical protein
VALKSSALPALGGVAAGRAGGRKRGRRNAENERKRKARARNVSQARAFSEWLEAAISRYHAMWNYLTWFRSAC